jgi:hypothetical protein
MIERSRDAAEPGLVARKHQCRGERMHAVAARDVRMACGDASMDGECALDRCLRHRFVVVARDGHCMLLVAHCRWRRIATLGMRARGRE